LSSISECLESILVLEVQVSKFKNRMRRSGDLMSLGQRCSCDLATHSAAVRCFNE